MIQMKPPPPKVVNHVRDECKHLRAKIDVFVVDNRLQEFYNQRIRKLTHLRFNSGLVRSITSLTESELKQLLSELKRKVNPNG